MVRIVVAMQCPKCRRENSSKTIKCIECGHLFFTNEEIMARHPPGRGGPHWWKRYHSDGTPKDIAEMYRQDVGKVWTPDPECHSRDAWIAPDGTFWPCGREQHFHISPVLVAHYDLYGPPSVKEEGGRGGLIDRDEYGMEYYKETVRYPDSVRILKESGFILLGRAAGGGWDRSAIYYDKNPTHAQRATIEKWRVVNEVDHIHYYDKRRGA